MGVKRRGRCSKQMADRFAHPAAQFVAALSHVCGGLDRNSSFNKRLVNFALEHAHNCVTQVRLLLPGLPSTERVCREPDPFIKAQLYCDWGLMAADVDVSAAMDDDVVENKRLDELERSIEDLYILPLLVKTAWLREDRDREQALTPATTAQAEWTSGTTANGDEGSAAKLSESSNRRGPAIGQPGVAIDYDSKIAPPSLSPAAASDVVDAPHERSGELAEPVLSPAVERSESPGLRSALNTAAADAVDASSGANADGGSRAADQSNVHGTPRNPPDAAGAVDHAQNSSGVVDEAVERIRERLPQSSSQERAIAVLAGLRSHKSDWLSAADLNRAGISSKTVFAAAQRVDSKLMRSARGAPAAPKSYAKTAVISFVVNTWTPRAKRPARDVNSSSG